MFRTFLSAYPWDLLDEDLEAVLDHLHGEVGITGMSVWVASAAVVELRARNVQPQVFRTRGGLLFHPDENLYADTRCKPIVSTWARGHKALGRIAEACAKRGLTLRVIVSASRTGRLAERHPEMACKNVFQDQSQLGLCLSNPDVQTFLCAVVSDLSSNHPVAEVVLTDFVLEWPEFVAAHLCAPLSLGHGAKALLATCFCESCRQQAGQAGVDTATAQRVAHSAVLASLEGRMTDQPLDAILADSGPLSEYYRWRTIQLSSVWQQVAGACRCDLLLDRRLDTSIAVEIPQLDLSLPASVVTRLDDPDGLASARCPVARRNELRLPESLASGPQAAQLVRLVSQTVELGFSGVEMDSLGLLPASALTPIKQALRIARRASSPPP